MPDQILSCIDTIMVAIIGCLLLGIGFRGMFKGTPLVLHSSISASLLLLLALINVTAPFESHKGSLEPISVVLGSLILLCTAISLLERRAYRMRGYQIYGVSAPVFRDCLHKALDKVTLPFDDQVFSIKLETLQTDLQVGAQNWIGMAQLGINSPQHRTTLVEIAKNLENEFAVNAVKAEKPVFVVCILLGLLFLGLMYECAKLYL